MSGSSAVSKYNAGENWIRFKALMIREPDWHMVWLVHGLIVQGLDGTGTGWYRDLDGTRNLFV